jgi:hypothetical protein
MSGILNRPYLKVDCCGYKLILLEMRYIDIFSWQMDIKNRNIQIITNYYGILSKPSL